MTVAQPLAHKLILHRFIFYVNKHKSICRNGAIFAVNHNIPASVALCCANVINRYCRQKYRMKRIYCATQPPPCRLTSVALNTMAEITRTGRFPRTIFRKLIRLRLDSVSGSIPATGSPGSPFRPDTECGNRPEYDPPMFGQRC